MIHIIAVNIKVGGGLILLKYLINYLSNNSIKSVVHIDSNINLNHLSCSSKITFKSYNSPLKKLLLFTKNINNCLYFGNIPPVFNFSNRKYLYFHNFFYLKSYTYLLKNKNYKFFLQKIYIKLFSKFITKTFVQSNFIKNEFSKSFNKNVEVIPLFQPFSENFDYPDRTTLYDFAYIAIPNPNKNFKNLFRALVLLSKENINLSIALTVPPHEKNIISKINEFNSSSIRITNLGTLSHNEVFNTLSSTRALIFPSLFESFGLPLIEAAQLGKFILASDLKYVHDVIKPTGVFNPNSPEDIASCIRNFLINNNKKKSELKCRNEIGKLIKILENV